AASQSEAIGRLASLSLRSGINPHYIVEQLKGISCHRPTWDGGEKILSCADAIGKAIEEFINLKADEQPSIQLKLELAQHAKTKKEIMLIGACPDCGSSLEVNEGCITCRACGYSECG
ncbi:MAG: TSCPD domain-containing protein, partial [Candidatus Delongbacteria bacterium]|nr:TSCPD domain-containing protein [Candidatus Delongbacteria bacterium]